MNSGENYIVCVPLSFFGELCGIVFVIFKVLQKIQSKQKIHKYK